MVSIAFVNKSNWRLSHLLITVASMAALCWRSRLRCHWMTTCCRMHRRSRRRRSAFKIMILGSLFRSLIFIHSFWLHHLRHFFGFCPFFANHRLWYDLLIDSIKSFGACEISLLEVYVMVYAAFLAGALRLLDCSFRGHFFNHDFARGLLLNWQKLRLVLLEL